MQSFDNNIKAFLALIRAGLWEREVQFVSCGPIDILKIYQVSEEQSITGLVTAGLEHIIDEKVPQDVILQFVGRAIQIEQKNILMNGFIKDLMGKLRSQGVYALLLKGQGVAQCYERPLWRVSGDIDLLLSESNYKKAKDIFLAISNNVKEEGVYSKHLGLYIDPWYIELHGSLRSTLSAKMDKELDAVVEDVFFNGKVRSWINNGTHVFLLEETCDVFFVFTHFVRHFYQNDTCLRQLCDWCRLLWSFRDSINRVVLEKRLQNAGLMSEWRSFASLAVNYLGMPIEAMPFFEDKKCWRKKGKKILDLILFGYKHNAYLYTFELVKILPRNTIRFLPSIFLNVNGLKIKERLLGRK